MTGLGCSPTWLAWLPRRAWAPDLLYLRDQDADRVRLTRLRRAAASPGGQPGGLTAVLLLWTQVSGWVIVTSVDAQNLDCGEDCDSEETQQPPAPEAMMCASHLRRRRTDPARRAHPAASRSGTGLLARPPAAIPSAPRASSNVAPREMPGREQQFLTESRVAAWVPLAQRPTLTAGSVQ